MEDVNLDEANVEALIAEEAKAEKAKRAELSASVPDDFIGAPTLPRDERWRVLRRAKRHLWHTRLADAEALLAPHRAADLGAQLALTEVALWRVSLHEDAASKAALAAQLDALDAHAAAALARVRAYVSARHANGAALLGADGGGVLAWFTGSASAPSLDSVPSPAVAALDALDEPARCTLLLDAALTAAFVPVARAVTALRDGTKTGLITGAYHLRKGWKAFEAAQRQAERLGPHADENAKHVVAFAMGVFQFVVSIIPPTFRWLIELIGFDGDRDKAVAHLADARRSGVVGREATLFLGIIEYFFRDEKIRPKRWMRRLLKANEESPLLLSLAARWARQEGHISDSLQLYKRALGSPHFDAPQLKSTINYHIGMCYFAVNDWKLAEEHLDVFLKTTKGRVFRCYAAFRCGVAKWHTGNRADIQPLYEEAVTWVRDHESFDAYAGWRMMLFLKRGGFDTFEEIYDAAEGLMEAREERKALELLDKATPYLKEVGVRDYFAQFYYIKGACLKNIKQFERSEKFLRSAIAELPRTQMQPHHAVVYSLCTLGELLMNERKDYEGAKKAFSEAMQLPQKYHWHKMLHGRVRANLEKLEKFKSGKLSHSDAAAADEKADSFGVSLDSLDDEHDTASDDDADWGHHDE